MHALMRGSRVCRHWHATSIRILLCHKKDHALRDKMKDRCHGRGQGRRAAGGSKEGSGR